jgi:predicted amino acid dehydrogenase
VTTGDSYTVALVARALLMGGRRIGLEPEDATAAVVGATGAIGSASARLLAPRVGRLILVGKRASRLQEVARLIDQADGPATVLSTRMESIREADLVASMTSAARPIIYPEHLKPGAVVCDVALPPDVSPRVARERDDVLVLDGGLARVPDEVDFNFDYGLPSGMTFGCMAEVMVLALEGRFEDFTVGKDLSVGRVLEIERMADKHGFSLAEFRSFNQPLTDEQVEAIRCRVGRGTGGFCGLASEVTQ